MTGENTLTLNQATLVKAIQYWLEHEVMKAPVAVRSVCVDENMSGILSVRVSLTEAKKEAA